jgi:hypothetical protein
MINCFDQSPLIAVLRDKQVQMADDGSVPYFQDMDDNEHLVENYFCADVEIRNVNADIPELMGIVAKKELLPGTVIFISSNEVVSQRSRTSLQVGMNLHMEPNLFGRYTNHSCSPNAAVRVIRNRKGFPLALLLFLIEKTEANREITFDYASTESELTLDADKTICMCGGSECRGKLMGYHQLTLAQKEALRRRNLPTEFISSLCE